MRARKEAPSVSRRDFLEVAGGSLLAATAASAVRTTPAMAKGFPKAKALTFDLYGTLLRVEAVPEKLGKFFSDRGITADPRQFWSTWLSKLLVFSMYNTMIAKGFEPFFELSKKAVRTTANILKVNLKGDDVTVLAEFWNQLEPYADVIPGLEKFRKQGYLLAPLTNGNKTMVVEGLIDRVNFKWDHLFTADMWGVNKPHPHIYLKSLEAWGFRPEEVIHIGRVQFDIFGAKGVGMRMAWINRANEPLDEYGYRSDWTVKDFLELAKIFETEKP